MKERLVEGLTKAAADATAIPQSSFIVLVDEYPDDAIGIGGRTLSAIKSAHPGA
jgi:4-oxalocrotonate tautomerase